MIHNAYYDFFSDDEQDERYQRRRRMLSRALADELTERQREILQLYYEEDLNFTEIAARLGLAVSTVSRTHARAIRRLRRCLRYCE